MLGRVVIPREYRKLNKIKPGDPLEILMQENGNIVVRKFDISAELVNLGLPIANEVAETLGKPVSLANEEEFLIATSTEMTDRVQARNLSTTARDLVQKRKFFSGKSSEIGFSIGDYVMFMPVSCDDVFGALVVFSDSEFSEWDIKVLQLTAKILGNTMQRF